MANSDKAPTDEQVLAAAWSVKAKRLEKAGQLAGFLDQLEQQMPGARQYLRDALNDHAKRVGESGW